MKHFLLLILFSYALTAHGQLASGSKLPENLVFTDLDGNEHDVFSILDSGKSVIIDVFATWCGPCWSFHRSGTLEQLYTDFGPNGTDQIRVFGIEGDDQTTLDDMYMQSNASWGNWVEGVDYPLANTSSLNSALKISFFPTLYLIRPDRTILEMGDFRYNDEVWNRAIAPKGDKDVYVTTSTFSKSFCTVSVFTTKPQFINLGATEINEVDAEMTFGSEVVPVILNGPIGVFETGTLPFDSRQIKESMDVSLEIVSVDGVADVPEDNWVSHYVSPLIDNDTFVVKFTTDFYPGETTFKITGGGKTLLNKTYKAGPESEGGGGDDANNEFVYQIVIPSTTTNCLTFNIADAYGDGLTAFNPSQHPVPGIVIEALDGTVIKENLGEWNFESSISAFSRADLTSSLSDADIVESYNIFPNPVSNILNIQINTKDNADYNLFITDITGKQVSQNLKNVNFIDVQSLEQGLYFLNIKTDAGLFTHKFTKM